MVDTPSASVADSAPLFDKALETWTLIDLPALQKDLDTYGLKFQDYQKESLVGRKELATKTKGFKKLADGDKLGAINALLKSYQKEIDDLAKKNKTVDNVFFRIYRAIAEAPDPSPLLQMSLDAISSVSELDKVNAEKRELEQKLVSMADYDQLRSKISDLEQEMAHNAETQALEKDVEWQGLLEEKQKNWAEHGKEYEATISQLNKQIEEMKVDEQVLKKKIQYKSKALHEMGANDDDNDLVDDSVKERAVSSMELEILRRDVDSSKLRILELEKRNEELSGELKVSRSGAESSKQRQDSNKRINELESENAVLVARLEDERQRLDSLEEQQKAAKEAAAKSKKLTQKELDSLKEYKSQTQDYEDIKQELETMRQIQFGDEDGNGQELDNALVQRNKKLNDEVINYRSANSDLQKQMKELKTQLDNSTAELAESRQLNTKLESDLENVENSAEKWETMSMISSVAPSAAGGKVSPATSIAGGALDSRSVVTAQDSSILPIITQQRDRFRRRNKELEEENKKSFTKVNDLKRELQSLKTDNRDLYEKIRFMEYQRTQPTALQQSDVEDRYGQSYETELHPIEKFRLLESKRISSRLSPFERVFIQVTKLVLSTPLTRWLFVFYCFGLHALVVVLVISVLGTTGTGDAIQEAVLDGSTGGFARDN